MASNLFPTHADLAFYQARQELPQWAAALAKPAVVHVDIIDHVVNAHASVRPTSGELAAHNLMALVRSRQRRGGNIAQALQELAQHPQCAINPEKRASFARKWAARVEVSS